MMEKLGQAKTHLELKKMIAEVDTNNSGWISIFRNVCLIWKYTLYNYMSLVIVKGL